VAKLFTNLSNIKTKKCQTHCVQKTRCQDPTGHNMDEYKKCKVGPITGHDGPEGGLEV
jgi:hypothetical protein